MTKLFLTLGAIVAANAGGTGALAGPASQPVVVVGEPAPAATRHVSYADLDLSTRDGERALIRRVRGAVHHVCVEEVGPSAIVYVTNSCRKLTWRDTEPQVDRAIGRSRQAAASGTSSMAAAVIVVRAAQ